MGRRQSIDQCWYYDRITEPAEQVRRLIARDGLTSEEARARLAAQWPIEEKAARADYLIRTDGTLTETDASVKHVFQRLSAEPR